MVRESESSPLWVWLAAVLLAFGVFIYVVGVYVVEYLMTLF
jgi:hypothetical protein